MIAWGFEDEEAEVASSLKGEAQNWRRHGHCNSVGQSQAQNQPRCSITSQQKRTARNLPPLFIFSIAHDHTGAADPEFWAALVLADLRVWGGDNAVMRSQGCQEVQGWRRTQDEDNDKEHLGEKAAEQSPQEG